MKMHFKTLLILTLFALSIAACSHYDELQKNGLESSEGGSSHNAGQDCMRCHHDAGNEASDRWWNIAGTAYYSDGRLASSGGEVQLWTNPGATGTLLYKLKIDQSGNFYTEKIIDFKGGYHAVIISGNDTFAMTAKVADTELKKSCNNCHGDGRSTARITLK